MKNNLQEPNKSTESPFSSTFHYSNSEYQPDFILYFNTGGFITNYNSFTLERPGYKFSEIQNRHFTEFIYTKDLDKVTNFYLTQFKDKIPDSYLTFRYSTKDMKEQWVALRSILMIENERIIGFKVIGINISQDSPLSEGYLSIFKSNRFNSLYEEEIDILDRAFAKVLIVEDSKINQLVTSKFLEHWNIKAETADNGNEAIIMAGSNIYDLILMDLQMPGIDGYDACKYIRQNLNKPFSDVPIIALTSMEFSNFNEYNKAGFDEYIMKPFNPVKLQHTIFKYISSKFLGTSINYDWNKNYLNLETTDLTYLYEISNGNENFIKNIIKVFLEQLPLHLIELKEAGHVWNFDDTGRIAHKIKGVLSTMGVLVLEPSITILESLVTWKDESSLIEEQIFKINKVCSLGFLELAEKMC